MLKEVAAHFAFLKKGRDDMARDIGKVLCMCVVSQGVSECVCVRETERERERLWVCVCVCGCVCARAHACMIVYIHVLHACHVCMHVCF